MRTPFGSVMKSWRSAPSGVSLSLASTPAAASCAASASKSLAAKAAGRPLGRRGIYPGCVRLVLGAVGEVHARNVVEVQPAACERKVGAVARREPEGGAIEALAGFDVIRQNEQVVEPPEHQPTTVSRASPST
jgi:hypothetical protein